MKLMQILIQIRRLGETQQKYLKNIVNKRLDCFELIALAMTGRGIAGLKYGKLNGLGILAQQKNSPKPLNL